MPGKEVEKILSYEDENECLQKLRILLAEDDKLSILQYEDVYLKRFLYSTDFIAEYTIKKMKLFYDLLGEHPEWFALKPPTEKKNIIEQDIRILTDLHDKQGRPVYIVKIGNMSASTMDLVTDVVPVDDMFMELLFLTMPSSKHGVCVIIDISNLHWNVLKWLTPHNIKIALRRMQTMPVKEYKFHVVKSSRIVHLAVNIIWPFLPQKIKEGVMFHYDDWNSFHEYVDKEVLPPEFGGSGSMIDSKKFKDQLYERDVEIADSFEMYRRPYINHIEKNI